MYSLPLKTLSLNPDLNEKNLFFFHHIPKCGGTSAAKAMRKWFKIEFDLVELSRGINEFIKRRINLNSLCIETCITGHFHSEGIYLFQRYPEILNYDNLKVVTFVREPVEIVTSLYYYAKNMGEYKDDSLEDALMYSDNFLSKIFPCTEENYKEILDRYFFIGITNRMQESFNKLANLLNKRKIIVQFENMTKRDNQIQILNEDFIEKFKEKNKLDYMIYDYCKDKFNRI